MSNAAHAESDAQPSRTRAERGSPKDGRISVVISNSILAALSAGVGAFGASQFQTPNEARDALLAAQIQERVLNRVDELYMSKGIAEERWGRQAERLEGQLAAIRVEMAALRQQIERERR